MYDAVYEITVTNRGAGAGSYDLDDELAPGEGVRIVGVQDVTTDAADPVGLNPAFDGVTDPRIVTDQGIAGAENGPVSHRYTVVVRYAAELGDVPVTDTDACSTDTGTVPGGLNNVAAVDWNGLRGEDEACVRPGKPTLDKSLVSAEPVGDGLWEVVYDLTVGNVGGEATTYDLDDELLFAPSISVAAVNVTGPDGVAIDPEFDGDAHRRIATDVSIAGLDDDGYAPHVYRVTVRAEVPLHFDEPAADGTGSSGCTLPSGSNRVEQGLNNAATLTDETGGEVVDTDCAPVPSIDIAKELDGKPSQAADGTWTVDYRITVRNDGGAEGEYTLTDRLRYGAGIEVETARVTEAPEGVALAAGWTGQGAEGADENVVATGALTAGSTHTYRVRVTANLDTDRADATTLACPAPGADGPGGFANTAGVAHNGLAAAATACDTPDWPEGVPHPLVVTGGTIGSLIGGAALLLVAGALILARRRRAPSA